MALRAGLIGYGLAGKVFHAPLLHAAGIEVAFVATHRDAALAQDFPKAHALPDPMAVATSTDVDLVVVASPNDSHFPLAMAALQTGHAVVIDKPFTRTAEEAGQLIALARKKDLVLSAFHNRRWDSDFMTFRACMERGDLGGVLSYECRFDRFRPQVTERWRERPVPGGGLLYDLGPHLVDQALTLFGWPDWLLADINIQRPGSAVDDDFRILMGKGKLRVLLSATHMAPGPGPKFVVHGDHGSFVKYGMDVQEDQLKTGTRPGDPDYGMEPTENAARLSIVGPGGKVTTPLPTLRGNYPAYYVGVRRAMEESAPVPVRAEDARDTIRVLELAIRSHQEGKKVLTPR
ncbi:MAG: oxidoreductase [Acidobacteriaceae bacterium]